MQDDAFYSALTARDARFDGVFFVGVSSTGIYCRPVCTARTPRRENCRFFASPEAAEKARYRPCLRCRPELAPGSAPVDDAGRIASAVARRIEEGGSDEGRSLEAISEEFELSSRQVRRIVQREFGVSPIELVQTRRLLLAKQLLTETALPVSQVAFSSGFSSLRRFNDAFLMRYGIPPTRIRRDAGAARRGSDTVTLRMGYRAPLDWHGLLAFLGLRAVAGLEVVTDDAYARTMQIGPKRGWVRVRDLAARSALQVEIAPGLLDVLPAVLGRLRALFDLTARPDVIATHFAEDPLIGPHFARVPGLRVPGTADGFELSVRAILGQQVSVRSATAAFGRYVKAFGDSFETPIDGLSLLAPSVECLAATHPDTVAAAGIIGSRAGTIVRLARELVDGRLSLDAGAVSEQTIARLQAIPGIGPWTAHYIAMRALGWPDAFLAGDVVVRRAMGGPTIAEAERQSRAWSPWRSYAVMALWRDK